MQEPGDSDNDEKQGPAPNEQESQEPTVELRRSCDFCVRLKRACDGKSPCNLCSRRNKPCTRSARKKSGPAKGTKYAPRRKRGAIAEWADRAATATDIGRAADPGLPPPLPRRDAPLPSPGPGPGESLGSGGAHGRQASSLTPSLLVGSSPMSPSSFLGHTRAMGGGGMMAREESPAGGSRGRGMPQQHLRGDFGVPSMTSRSPPRQHAGPFRGERFAQQQESESPHTTAEASAARSSVGHPRSPDAASLSVAGPPNQQRRQQHGGGGNPAAWSGWAAEATSSSGLSRLEAAAAAAVEAAAAAAAGGGAPGGPARDAEATYTVQAGGTGGGAQGSFFPMPGASASDAGGDDRRRDRATPFNWERSSSAPRDDFGGSGVGSGHGGRFRLPPPPVGTSSRYEVNPFERDLSGMAPRYSPAGSNLGGGAISRSPLGEHRRMSSAEGRDTLVSSSMVFRPSPREPPDPTAGFGFRPSPQPLSWRISPQAFPRDVHGRDVPPGGVPSRGEPLSYSSRESRDRSVEVGGRGGDQGDQQRRWTIGSPREEVGGGGSEWRPQWHRLPPPSTAARPSPPRPLDHHHPPRDWGPYGGGGSVGGRRSSSGGEGEMRYYHSPSSMAAARYEGRRERPDEAEFRRYEWHPRGDDRTDERAGPGGGYYARSGEGFARGGGGGGAGGDEASDRRMGGEDQQWHPPLDSGHQSRQDWGFDRPRKRTLSPPRQSGDIGVEGPRSEEHQRWRAGGGGGSAARGGAAGEWGTQERHVRRRSTGSAETFPSELGGTGMEAGPTVAPRGSLESDSAGVRGSGSPTSQGSRSGRRSPMEVGMRSTLASTSTHGSEGVGRGRARGGGGGGDRHEEWFDRRRGEARIESILSPMAAPAPAAVEEPAVSSGGGGHGGGGGSGNGGGGDGDGGGRT